MLEKEGGERGHRSSEKMTTSGFDVFISTDSSMENTEADKEENEEV